MYLLAEDQSSQLHDRGLIESPDPRTGIHTFVLNLRYHEEADYLRPFA
jgi:hypothetical protein